MSKTNKFLKIFNYTLIGVLAAGSAFTMGVVIYKHINPTIKDDFEFQYNDTFLSLDKEAKEGKAKADIEESNFYQNCTSALGIRKYLGKNEYSSQYTLGTIWAYPSPRQDDRIYFATNIHVIENAITTPVESSLNLNPSYHFFVNRNAEGDMLEKNFNWGYRLQDVKLESIGFRNNDESYSAGLFGKNERIDDYSDFAIMSCKKERNPFGREVENYVSSKGKLEFATPNEMEKIFNPSEDKENLFDDYIYISGFPGVNNPKYEFSYKSIKIDIKKLEAPYIQTSDSPNPESFITNRRKGYIPYTTSRIAFQDNNKFQDSGIHIATTKKEAKYVSYTNQLLVPRLNIGPGSSGSVFTYYDNASDKIKILGIWWGSYITSIGKSKFYDGVADLFISNPYIINAHKKVQSGYDNTKINPESLNINTNNFYNGIKK